MHRILLTTLVLLLSGCTSSPSHSFTTPLTPAEFNDLQGWGTEQAVAARPALLNSCHKLSRKNFDHRLPLGSYEQWQGLCGQLAKVDDQNLKAFFEDRFKVYRVDSTKKGLFTGYYSPVYEGRLKKEPGFEVPLLKVPEGQHGRALRKSDTRTVIEQKIRDGKVSDDQVLVWIKDPKDKFFLQIQGSGNIRLKDGSILHAAYAGNNGQKYVAIGRVLKASGELDKVSMASIRAWLEANPDKQQVLFNQNPRYIFFRKGHVGAITAQGVPAMAHRTLAVDPTYIPYGTPLWVETELTVSQTPYRQMMVAQDTGSAIKGAVRGDIYMGTGLEAAALAGPQQSPGKLYVIVPRKNK